MIDKKDNEMLKLFTGLEGGVVASGSTCGVISGGAMGLAISHYDEIIKNGLPAQIGMLSMVGDYVKWFGDNYGSTYCRERSGVDFYSAMGQLRYLIPGDKTLKCMWHLRGAMRHLYEYRKKELPIAKVNDDENQEEPVHCAKDVLTGIKERTGIGNDALEQLSFVFDGGIGLQGGVCGAIAGAIMGINFLFGLNIRDISYFQSVKAFTVGHINLLRNKPIKTPEPFNVGKQIIEKFKNEAGEMECKAITGKSFTEWTEFQSFIRSSEKCTGLIELVTNEASKAIEMYKPMIA